ncbi:D-alanyl-D-alanine carboxypeptidase family protein [Henriciella aquimarina]|uniref:D-alanyl-D-alanine carboxypeptidase family protein n=1 Tax=Henriciella aquimarina TaxID=545261 RepID=UPI0009FEB0FD|nr:D-alanyl-D-alanine carboxypeptidase family protein [Henriciella aquimarina]
MAIRAGGKKIRAVLGALALCVAMAPAAIAEKYASIVVDAQTNEVLHARHADEPRYPASLTKAMTLYMLFDALKAGEVTFDEKLYVSRHAASQPPSALRLRAGSSISVRDAINALVTKSANDVAAVVGERLGGTESRFATLMTAKAKALGMSNTTFRNASGLPDTQQLSTARDMAILAERLLEDHADYYHYFATSSFDWGSRTYKNHNNLLDRVDGVDGIKTGYTRASGFNLMASATRDGHRIIAIMFGGSTSKSRDAHVTDLIEAAYESYDENDKADALKADYAFSALQSPVNPNGAAMPMLNGQVYSDRPVGEGDESTLEELVPSGGQGGK